MNDNPWQGPEDPRPHGDSEQTGATAPIPPVPPPPPSYSGPTAPPPGYTASYPTQNYGTPPYRGFGQPSAPPPQPRRERRGGLGFAAGMIAVALVAGGAAGVGTAAAYHHDDSSSAGSGLVVASPSQSAQSSQTNANAPQGSVEKVAADVLPSVVKIEVEGSTEAGSGSGIILSRSGDILTNNHVVAIAGKSGRIRVDFNDGSTEMATIVGTDPITDTAVIKVPQTKELVPATIGSSNAVKVGQSVVAIGSPFGLDSTVTSGIVSALNRPVDVGQTGKNAIVYPAIQTDAAINPGNSGGPLVNLDGQVVGINASIQSTTSDSSDSEAGSIGLGFAIPIDEVMPVIQQMIKGETPTHARLGIEVSPNTTPNGDAQDGLFEPNGAKVQTVESGSPAQKAGLKPGDVITSVDGKLISSSDALVATIRSYRPGDTVKVTWTRGGKQMSAEVTLESDASSTNS